MGMNSRLSRRNRCLPNKLLKIYIFLVALIISILLFLKPTIPVVAQIPKLVNLSVDRPSCPNLRLEQIHQQIARLSQTIHGSLGVSAIHLESGCRVAFNAEKRFLMASTYKVPIAIKVLQLVDQGEVTFSQLIPIQQQDLRLEPSVLSKYFYIPGISVSIRNLLELMLVDSDNSATDVILKITSGAESVKSLIHSFGIKNMSVDRSEAELYADELGITLPSENLWSSELFEQLAASVGEDTLNRFSQNPENDIRDTTTPKAMTKLLEYLYEGQILKTETTQMLLNIMNRCRTGENRLKGLLPPDVKVAHRTGTLRNGVTNDVGIITMPENSEHIVLSVYVKGRAENIRQSERLIAEVSRNIYDFFLFKLERK